MRPVHGRDTTGADPRARRVSAPSWRDPRLLVGLLLVLVSVVVGATVVGRARDTTGVWALTRPVGAGRSITTEDLRVVQVHLDPATLAGYVPAGTDPSRGAVALRGLAAGELLPVGALGRVGDLTSRPVTVPVEGNVPQGVAVGALVDVWVVPAAPVAGQEAVPAPERLVEAAEVSAVDDGGGALSSRGGADVQVVVPQGALPAVLRAVSDDDDLVLVPVPGGGA
ncbi:flagellar protein FlgA [Kineococcus aurantiacus]